MRMFGIILGPQNNAITNSQAWCQIGERLEFELERPHRKIMDTVIRIGKETAQSQRVQLFISRLPFSENSRAINLSIDFLLRISASRNSVPRKTGYQPITSKM